MGKTKTAVSVAELVRRALLGAADAPDGAKLSGKGGLFSGATGANKEAIDQCLNAEKPLLTVLRKEGKSEIVALAPAGFERIAGELADEKVGAAAKAVAGPIPPVERVAFLQGVMGRTPSTAAELTPLLDEAVAAKKAELEATAAAKAKAAGAAAANRAALERALELSKQDFENELNAIRRQWEALGQKLSDLPVHKPAPESTLPQKVVTTRPAPEPRTEEEKDFRRYECDRLAAAWREAWDAKKDEGRDYLETAMWNIRGLRMIGEVGVEVPFDGRRHESATSVFTDDPVRIVRPGWLLKTDDEEYVALKAAVQEVRGT